MRFETKPNVEAHVMPAGADLYSKVIRGIHFQLCAFSLSLHNVVKSQLTSHEETQLCPTRNTNSAV